MINLGGSAAFFENERDIDGRIDDLAASLSHRSFSLADQEGFARLCGDRNPMHMDPVFARRTQAGSCAVHGMHAFLWALEVIAQSLPRPARLTEARVSFLRFISLDAPVELRAVAQSTDRIRVELRQTGTRKAQVDLRCGSYSEIEALPAHGEAVRVPQVPRDLPFEALEALQGRLHLRDGAARAAAEMFPNLSAALGAGRIAAIAHLSALVGMLVPGLHSIFSGFDLALAAGHDEGSFLDYRVVRVDERFRLASTQVRARSFEAMVRSFVRFPPVEPPTLDRLSGLVRPDEFAGHRALVIGGSRGIGAATAKLLAAGGASVAITYRNGRAEAEAIRDAIAGRFGDDRCMILAFDAGGDVAAQLGEVEFPITHAYYFPTARIFHQDQGVFDPARFSRFLEIYITAFHRLAMFLQERAGDRGVSILYPSSVAVEERPAKMTEYAMSKAAGEILCTDLGRANKRLSISKPRLPRMLTDQTASVPPVPAADPVEVMLPLLRAEPEF